MGANGFARLLSRQIALSWLYEKRPLAFSPQPRYSRRMQAVMSISKYVRHLGAASIFAAFFLSAASADQEARQAPPFRAGKESAAFAIQSQLPEPGY